MSLSGSVIFDDYPPRTNRKLLHVEGPPSLTRLVPEVELGPAFPLNVRRLGINREVMTDKIELLLEVTVPDRTTGRTTSIFQHRRFDQAYFLGMSRSEALTQVCDMLKTAVLHEMDEGIFVNGELLNDPHKLDRK